MDEDWPHPELDAAEVLRVLGRHKVDYVLIGGLALALYGSNQLTFDIDLVPAAEHANLDRLANAMRELRAKGATNPTWDSQIFSGVGVDVSAGVGVIRMPLIHIPVAGMLERGRSVLGELAGEQTHPGKHRTDLPETSL